LPFAFVDVSVDLFPYFFVFLFATPPYFSANESKKLAAFPLLAKI